MNGFFSSFYWEAIRWKSAISVWFDREYTPICETHIHQINETNIFRNSSSIGVDRYTEQREENKIEKNTAKKRKKRSKIKIRKAKITKHTPVATTEQKKKIKKNNNKIGRIEANEKVAKR